MLEKTEKWYQKRPEEIVDGWIVEARDDGVSFAAIVGVADDFNFSAGQKSEFLRYAFMRMLSAGAFAASGGDVSVGGWRKLDFASSSDEGVARHLEQICQSPHSERDYLWGLWMTYGRVSS